MRLPPLPPPLWLALGAGALVLWLWPEQEGGLPGGADALRLPAGTSPARRALLEAAAARLGQLYEWGGGRQPGKDYGVDCSGLVIAASRDAHVPLPPCPLATSDGWYRCLPHLAEPQPGDLALYGTAQRVVHVELVVDWDGAVARTIGAEGGDRDVTTAQIATERNANVRFATTAGRKNFVTFVHNPVDDSSLGEGVRIAFALQPDEA